MIMPIFRILETTEDTLTLWARELNHFLNNLNNDGGYLTVGNIQITDLSDDLHDQIDASDVTDTITALNVQLAEHTAELAQITNDMTSVITTDINGNWLVENTEQTQALKIGGGILAVSNSKDETGAYIWRTFLTGDGTTASEIYTGTLTAINIITGILTGASGTFTQLIAGNPSLQRLQQGIDAFGDPYFSIYDNENVRVLSIRKDGNYYSNGIKQVITVTGYYTCVDTFIE